MNKPIIIDLTLNPIAIEVNGEQLKEVPGIDLCEGCVFTYDHHPCQEDSCGPGTIFVQIDADEP